MENKKVVAGVSGGPDSMYLLNKLHTEGYEVIVCHINHGFRKESEEEYEMVKNFCSERNITFEGLSVKKEDWNKYEYLKNKQSMARELRYDFYTEIADKYSTKDIYIGHHKDDFLETAIMQQNRSDDYLFFGIEDKSLYKGYTLHRPLLDMYKEQIIKYNDENKIPYRIDESNLEPVYDRNRVRIQLNDKTEEEKDILIEQYNTINKSKEEIKLKTMEAYHNWRRSNFSYDFYINIDDEIKRYVIYRFLIKYKSRINISSDKLDGIIDFLKEKKGDKGYRLTENLRLGVRDSIIVVYEQ